MSAMQAVTNPQKNEWQPGHIPKLSYRNPAPPDAISPLQERKNLNDRPADSPTPAPLTIAQIRQSLPDPPPKAAQSPASPALPQKKKNSIFGGLFAKEPTQVALNQVAATLIAQHGSLSPKSVPHVRQEKMPEFVPKVNTKWDGVPDSIKAKERQEKERHRAAKHQPSMFPGARNYSMELGNTRGLRRRGSNSTSGADSFNSRDSLPGSRWVPPSSSNSSARNISSVHSSEDFITQPNHSFTSRSHSIGSSSATSLPERTAFSTTAVPRPPVIPAKFKIDPGHPGLLSHTRVGPGAHAVHQAPTIQRIHEHSSSPAATPRESSPITPSSIQVSSAGIGDSQHSLANEVQLNSAGSDVLGPPVVTKIGSRMPSAAFLAGEARPFEIPDDARSINVDPLDHAQGANTDLPLRNWTSTQNSNGHRVSTSTNIKTHDVQQRPESSRAKLGLRAHMTIRTEQAPWVAQDSAAVGPRTASPRLGIPASPTTASPKTTKGRSFFGSRNKR